MRLFDCHASKEGGPTTNRPRRLEEDQDDGDDGTKILSGDKDDVLPVLRALFWRYPQAACSGAEELADQLRAGGWMPRHVSVHEVEALVQSVEQRLERMEGGSEKLRGVEEQADDWLHYLLEKGGDVSAREAAAGKAASGRVKAMYEELQAVSEELQSLLDKVADDPEGQGRGEEVANG